MTESSGPVSAPARAVRTRGRRRRARSRWPQRITCGIALAGLAGLAWIVVTAVLARGHLEQARGSVSSVQAAIRSGNAEQAQSAARQLRSDAHDAHRLTTGPAWWLASQVPWVGQPLVSIRSVTAGIDGIGEALADVDSLAGDLSPQTLRTGPDTINVTAIQEAGTIAHRLAAAVSAARAGVDHAPASTWLGPVDAAHRQVADQLDTVAPVIGAADSACAVLPEMLGARGTRRYLVAFQNDAELRGSGGLPGAFAILSATDGTVQIEQILSDDAMGGITIPSSVAPELLPAWGQQPFTYFTDGNQSAHFPYAGRIWSAYWKAKSGESIDGVLALDPTAVSYILAATGGGILPTGQQVDAGNVVAFTQRQIYAEYPAFDQTSAREKVLIDVARLVSTKVFSGSGRVTGLLRAFSRSATEGRLLAWSTDPTVESRLAGHRIAGIIPDTAGPYSQVVVNNAAGGKLDYFLRRAVTVTRRGCGDTRRVDVAVTLTNTAPNTGLGAYTEALPQSGRDPALPPGGNRSYVDYVATRGALLQGADVNGVSTGISVYSEHGGHPMFRAKLPVLSGQTVTLTLHLVEPDNGQPLLVVQQPGVIALQSAVVDRSCRP